VTPDRAAAVGLAPAARARHAGRRRALTGYLFIAPNFVGLAVFTLGPLLFSFAIAFTQWDVASGLGGIRWVGLRNFVDIALDGKFWESARNTLVYAGVGVPATVALGLGLALALNGPIPGRSVLRLIFFIPFVANAVAISAVWILLYHPRYGPINAALSGLGVASPPGWLASSAWALPALIIMAIWGGLGYAAVIYLAALQDVPPELYEAAELDGAGPVARFRAVTLPFLTPSIFFLLVTGFIGWSQAFGMINLMTRGGPGRATTVLSYYIYQNGFQFYKMGYAAAMAWTMFFLVLALTLVAWRLQRRLVFYR
jgi:multiple sugar transport system permease protein